LVKWRRMSWQSGLAAKSTIVDLAADELPEPLVGNSTKVEMAAGTKGNRPPGEGEKPGGTATFPLTKDRT